MKRKQKRNKNPESKLCVEFAKEVNRLNASGCLTSCIWSFIRNELPRTKGVPPLFYILAGLNSKRKGMRKGFPDYVFIRNTSLRPSVIVLEAKSDKGKQTKEQEEVERICTDLGVPYYLFRTVKEGIGYLAKHQFLKIDSQIDKLKEGN